VPTAFFAPQPTSTPSLTHLAAYLSFVFSLQAEALLPGLDCWQLDPFELQVGHSFPLDWSLN
jgi:hypothetical protein